MLPLASLVPFLGTFFKDELMEIIKKLIVLFFFIFGCLFFGYAQNGLLESSNLSTIKIYQQLILTLIQMRNCLSFRAVLKHST